MKFSTLAALLPSKVEEAEHVSTGEHAVNFSTDLADFELEDEMEQHCLTIGKSAVRAGYTYEGKQGTTMRLVFKGSEEQIDVTLSPGAGNMNIKVENDGEQSFKWSDVVIAEFIDLTEGDMDHLKNALIKLVDALEGAQRFIGTAPEFYN